MTITDLIKEGTAEAVKELYNHDIEPANVTMNVTRKEFEGDYSVVVFPYTKSAAKKSVSFWLKNLITSLTSMSSKDSSIFKSMTIIGINI